ncbi:hypothetical protein UFOVP1304_2 [uncultured Caudovirales phage]|uniref:Uncharacterized protein n=1 Tax=uncultured Caudovirales phage TaxID=2100421 RepID=A0A6J5RU66_9CAUD|nr:hypothetical protein UFOVP1304_2 [uncultured Caudovirales phage]
MTRDEIMHLVNLSAPKYEPFGCEAHFQNFAQKLIQIERDTCALICNDMRNWLTAIVDRDGAEAAEQCGARIRARD